MLFGHGLVGQAVSQSVIQLKAETVPYNWQDSAQRANARAQLAARLQGGAPLRIIWTAGRAGFGSTPSEMASETTLLEEVLEFTGTLAQGRDTALLFTSSAGGLFEGMTHVTADTRPIPLRAYGQEKLRQEQALAAAADAAGFGHRIYRLSSIYGFAPKARLGLISVLILNALTDRTTEITGDVDTLRDYVFAADIGAFLAREALMGALPGSKPLLLASGRSVSIADIIALIEQRMPEPLKIAYQSVATNNAHMSFTLDSLPASWTPTGLTQGIEQTIALLRAHLAAR